MQSSYRFHWLTVNNNIKDRLSNNLVNNIYLPKNRKLMKKTALFNVQLCKNKSYSYTEFLKCKKNVLNKKIKNVSLTTENVLSDEVCYTYYNSAKRKGRTYKYKDNPQNSCDKKCHQNEEFDDNIASSIEKESDQKNVNKFDKTKTESINKTLPKKLRSSFDKKHVHDSKIKIKNHDHNVNQNCNMNIPQHNEVIRYDLRSNRSRSIQLKKITAPIKIDLKCSSAKKLNKHSSSSAKRKILSELKTITSKNIDDNRLMHSKRQSNINKDSFKNDRNKNRTNSVKNDINLRMRIRHQIIDSGIEDDLKEDNTTYKNLDKIKKTNTQFRKKNHNHNIIIMKNVVNLNNNTNAINRSVKKNKIIKMGKGENKPRIISDEKVINKYKIINIQDKKYLIVENSDIFGSYNDNNIDFSSKNLKYGTIIYKKNEKHKNLKFMKHVKQAKKNINQYYLLQKNEPKTDILKHINHLKPEQDRNKTNIKLNSNTKNKLKKKYPKNKTSKDVNTTEEYQNDTKIQKDRIKYSKLEHQNYNEQNVSQLTVQKKLRKKTALTTYDISDDKEFFNPKKSKNEKVVAVLYFVVKGAR